MPATPSLAQPGLAWDQEKLPVEKLSEQIQRLLGLLAQAHPYLATRKHSLLSRVTGSALVKRLDHHLAVQELPEVLQQSEAAAQRVRELWAHAKAVLEETSGQEAELKALLDGAQAWLRDHPEAGESDNALSASPRERLLKRYAKTPDEDGFTGVQDSLAHGIRFVADLLGGMPKSCKSGS
ncbi:MAG: hypothetical protein ACYCUK_00385 [Thiomonas sp.]